MEELSCDCKYRRFPYAETPPPGQTITCNKCGSEYRTPERVERIGLDKFELLQKFGEYLAKCVEWAEGTMSARDISVQRQLAEEIDQLATRAREIVPIVETLHAR